MPEMAKFRVLRGRYIGPQPRWYVDRDGNKVPKGTPGCVEVRGRSKVYGRDRDGKPLPDGDTFESETNFLDPVHNPPGYPPRFERYGPGADGYVSQYERRTDESAQDYANRLMKLALEAQDRAKAADVQQVSMAREPEKPAAPPAPSFTSPEFLARLDGMRLQELIDFAHSEEIDVAQVRGEKEVRKAIRAALDVRK